MASNKANNAAESRQKDGTLKATQKIRTPKKKPKNGELTQEEKEKNKEISSEFEPRINN